MNASTSLELSHQDPAWDLIYFVASALDVDGRLLEGKEENKKTPKAELKLQSFILNGSVWNTMFVFFCFLD